MILCSCVFASCQRCLTIRCGLKGQWGFPGGHLEFGESYFECAERESLEETGLRIKASKVFAVANTVFDSEHHYITIFVQCKQDNPDDQPQVSSLRPETIIDSECLSLRRKEILGAPC